MANYSNLKAAIAAAIKTNGNQEITGQVLQDVLNSMVSVIGANYTFAGVATPATNPSTPDQNVVYIASQAGTYTNFGGIQLPAGISLLMWNGSWTSKTVMCGDGGVFDISVYKSSGGTLATFADLSAALDGGNNIPASARKGGMSVKFVQSSDNKYIQARCMAQDFTTNVTQWQGVDDVPTYKSNNLAKSGGIYDSIINESNIANVSIEGLPNAVIYENRWFGTNNIINRNGSKLIVFRINKGDRIHFKANSANYGSLAFADSSLTYQLVNTIGTSENFDTIIESGISYLIVGAVYSGNNSRLPSEFTINGCDCNIGLLKETSNLLLCTKSFSYELTSEVSSSMVRHKTGMFVKKGDVLRISCSNASSDFEVRVAVGGGGYDYTALRSSDSTIWKSSATDFLDILSPITSIPVSCDILVEVMKEADRVVFVATDGNNDTGDGTLDHPYATLKKALSLHDKVVVRGGEYENVSIDMSDYTNKGIEITAYPAEKPILMNRKIIVSANEESKESGYTNIYKKTVADPEQKWIYQHLVNDVATAIEDDETHPLQRGLFYRCDCTKIEEIEIGSTYTTLAEALTFIDGKVSDNLYYYVYSDGVLYYSRPQTPTAEHPICCSKGSIIEGDNTGRNNTIHCTGISFYYGSVYLDNVDNSQFSDCANKYSVRGGCFSWSNCKNLTFRKCEAARSQHNNYGDGFSGNALTELQPITASVYLIDCWSHDNYDDGYSDHGGCNMCIYGGLYEYNGKGGVTPSFGSHCSGRDILSRHNKYGIYYTGHGEQQDHGKNGNATFFNCVSHNNREHGFFVSADGDNVNTMYCYNCISFNNISYGYRGRIYAYNCKTYNNVAGAKYGNVVVQALNDLT